MKTQKHVALVTVVVDVLAETPAELRAAIAALRLRHAPYVNVVSSSYALKSRSGALSVRLAPRSGENHE